jgi:PDZ domain-containing secreted protein|tara:strand:+ start:499 stop:768 length:270 start_codon:yes stop_codon:yes gene_type:complete
MEVNKQTKLTLSLETIISGAVTLGMLIGMWFTLQADIEEAKKLPPPTVSRTEYDLKDQMIRDAILDTQKDVGEMKEDIKNIENYILNSK